MRSVVVSLLTTLTVSVSVAQTNGAYMFATGGQSSTNFSCVPGAVCDKSGSVLFAGAGYRFSSGLSVEGIAATLGKAQDDSREVKTSAVGAAATFEFPLGASAAGLVRLGVANMNTGVRGIINGQLQGSRGDKYIKPFAGIEGSWNFAGKFDAILSLNSWSSEYGTSSLRLQSVSAGVRARF